MGGFHLPDSVIDNILYNILPISTRAILEFFFRLQKRTSKDYLRFSTRKSTILISVFERGLESLLIIVFLPKGTEICLLQPRKTLLEETIQPSDW